MNFEKALVVAAHPDDEILGCGGLISRQRVLGCPTDVLVVTDGSSAQYPGDKSKHARRCNQLNAACSIVGAGDIEHWDLPDMRLSDNDHLDLNIRLSRFISDGGYRHIFCHHPYDVNQDHKIIFASIMVATRPLPASKVESVWSYYTGSSSEWNFESHQTRFVPSMYLDISAHLDRKLEALEAYVDEIREYPHPRSIEAVRDRARTFGSEVGIEAAEPFHLHWQRVRY